MTATQISNEMLESYVQQGLEKLRKGELWISFHLQENDVIFPTTNEPDLNDKESNYYKFFDSVATDIGNNFVLDKKDKKRIRQKLHSQWKKWYGMIVVKDSNTKSTTTTTAAATTTTTTATTTEINDNDLNDPTPKKGKKSSSTKKTTSTVKGKKRKEKTTDEVDLLESFAVDGEGAIEEEIIPAPKERRVSRNLEEKKRQFEEARDLILADVPEDIKGRFGEIYFTKWGNQTLPCLVMNPYSVPPGNVRDTWLAMYDKVKANNRLNFMTNLVYWYGASKDPNNAYSFIESKKLVPYESATKKKLDDIPESTWQKYPNGKLTAAQKFFIDGILEMREDLPKKPHERFGYMKRDFLEAYAITSDEEDGEYDLDENLENDGGNDHGASIKKSKKKKATTKSPKDKEPKKSSGKRKKATEEILEDDEEETPAPAKKAKKKKKKPDEIPERKGSKIVKEEPRNDMDPAPVEETLASIAPVDESHDATTAPTIIVKREEPDDDYKFAMADSESDGEHDDDEDFNFGASAKVGEPSAPVKGKKKTTQAIKVEGKDLPKKKEKKVKHKVDKPIKKEKEVRTEEQRLKRAQKLFAISEKEFHPIFVGWQQAIDDKDEGKIATIMDEISSRVENIHFSLMADINELLKASKRVLSNDRKDALKTVRIALKIQYEEKKRDIPPDFKPNRKFPKIEVSPEVDAPPVSGPPVLVKSNDSSNSIAEEIPRTVSSANIKRMGSLEKVVEKPEPEIPVSQKEVKVERKKFSLGNLMRPTSDASKSGIKSEKTSSSLMSSTPKQQQSIPAWVTGKSSFSKPDDDHRAFAIEFLEQAAPFIPSGQDVNHSAIAHALEAAIYESVKKGDPSWLDKYWKKIDDIVVAISGDKGPGSISVMIANGEFESPESVVRLSDAAIYDSFLGRPVFLAP